MKRVMKMKTMTRFRAAMVLSLSCVVGLLNLSNCSLGRNADYGTETGESPARKYVSSETVKKHFLPGIKIPRETPDEIYARACFFQERKKHKLAIEEFNTILRIDPKYVKACNGLGISYDALGEYPRAIEAYTRALELSSDLDYVNNNLGYCYFLQGNLDAAIDHFKKAISLNSEKSLYHKNLALAYATKGDYDPALVELKLAGDEAKAHYTMGQFYYAKGLYPEARSQFVEAKAMNPALTGVEKYLDALEVLAHVPEGKDRHDIGLGALAAATRSGSIGKHERRSRERDRGETKALGAGKDNKRVVDDEGVEVSNGNGVPHMARDVGRFLSGNGVRVVALTNAAHFNHFITTVYHPKGYRDNAVVVARKLPGLQNVREADRPASRNAKIRVLIGRDLINQQSRFAGE
jgi:tetratricopeptide (TPR) repeat protein